eukprot:1160137-Pelagomonas_calceolata.AAC.21
MELLCKLGRPLRGHKTGTHLLRLYLSSSVKGETPPLPGHVQQAILFQGEAKGSVNLKLQAYAVQ